MKRRRFETFLAAVLSMNTVAWGQKPERDIAGEVAEAFQVTRDSVGNQNYSPPISKKMLKDHPKELLEALKPYENDPLRQIRLDAYMLVWRIGVSSTDPGIRQEVTWRLVNACEDPDSVWQYAARRLLSFGEADFTNDAKAVLHRLLIDDRVRRNDIIWVVGVAGMREELPRLRSFLLDDSRLQAGPYLGSASWPARLARARMGVEEDALRAIELVEREKNAITRVGKLLRHLGYTRQPAAFKYIATYLDSEERLPRVKDTAPGTLYAQYAMDVLAQNLPGFPAKTDNIGAHTQADIIRAREWMKSRRSPQ